MKFLHLDSTFTPFGKSIDFTAFTFNGGEPHIKIKEEIEGAEILISTRIKSFNDMGLLLIANDAVRRCNPKRVELLLPYFPAARQDRVMVKGEALSVKVYANLINHAAFDKVMIFDPHSEVTPALLDRVEVLTNHSFIKEILNQHAECLLISPDGGALKKVYKLSAQLGGIPVIECSKKREVQSGQLSGFRVYSDDLQKATCLIIDDICDGGGTFIGLAKALKEKNAGDLILAVSHGIFSKGVDVLKSYFKKIYCTDAFSTIEDPDIKQIKLKTLLS